MAHQIAVGSSAYADSNWIYRNPYTVQKIADVLIPEWLVFDPTIAQSMICNDSWNGNRSIEIRSQVQCSTSPDSTQLSHLLLTHLESSKSFETADYITNCVSLTGYS